MLLISFLLAKTQILYWGLTSKGGEYNVGTIFYTDRYGDQQYVVHSFEYGNGDSPIGGLNLASDGYLYGTTPRGNMDFGTIFQLDNGLMQYQKIFEFNEEQRTRKCNFCQTHLNLTSNPNKKP